MLYEVGCIGSCLSDFLAAHDYLLDSFWLLQDQYHCTETGFNTVENREKPLLVKKLKKLWEKYERNLPWERGEYNETNTLLIDDSPHKALGNPVKFKINMSLPTSYLR